jgi:hypothetical protein
VEGRAEGATVEATPCKSCGGVLQKVSDTEYRCAFCGTMHRLSLDDAKSVDALVEQNNQRWLSINRRMELFFAAINRASGHHTRYNGHRGRVIAFGVAGVLVFVILMIASSAPAAPDVKLPSKSEFAAIGNFWGSLVLIVVGVSVLMGWSEHKMRDRELTAARGILTDVLATYRTMSTRPASELLATLHNANMLLGAPAESMASQVYEQVMAAERSPPA